MENQFDTKIKIFRSDNGTKFIKQNFTNLFKEFFLHQTTCAYTPEQNIASKRKKNIIY
jgi:hypothetical protein